MIQQHQQQYHSESDSHPEITFQALSPQLRIYNRNFHLRRLKQQELQDEVQKQIHQLAETPKLTPGSYLILVQKLQHQLNQLLYEHSHQGHVDFQNFQIIVSKLGKYDEFTSQNDKVDLQLLLTQLWLLMVEYRLQKGEIDNNRLESLLHIMFCPYTLKNCQIIGLLEHAFPDMENRRLKYIEEYPEVGEEVLDLQGIVKLWLRLKRCKLSLYDKKVVKVYSQRPTFKPEINAKSKQYAERSLYKYLSNKRLDNIGQSKLNQLSGYISSGKELTYHQILYQRGLQKEQLLKTNREQAENNQQKQRTLTKDQTKNLVSNLYIKKQKREDVDQEKRKEDQELKLCTFQPKTINYEKRSTTPTVRNYNKVIERFQKARKDKQKQKQIYDNLGRVKQKCVGPPPSMVQREKPRLILQIKVGERVEQLRLRGDEQPRLVAKKFVIRHNLDDSMQQVLQSIIQEQLAAL